MQSKDQKSCAFQFSLYRDRILEKVTHHQEQNDLCKAYKQNDSKGQEIISQFMQIQHAQQDVH